VDLNTKKEVFFETNKQNSLDKISIWPFFKTKDVNGEYYLIFFYLSTFLSLIKYEKGSNGKTFKFLPWIYVHSSDDKFSIVLPFGIFFYFKDKSENSVTLGSLTFLTYLWRKEDQFSFYLFPFIRTKGVKGYSCFHLWPILSVIKEGSIYLIYRFKFLFNIQVQD
jgi:hypothetical protein